MVRGCSAECLYTLLLPLRTKMGIYFLGEELEMKSKNFASSFCFSRSFFIFVVSSLRSMV